MKIFQVAFSECCNLRNYLRKLRMASCKANSSDYRKHDKWHEQKHGNHKRADYSEQNNGDCELRRCTFHEGGQDFEQCSTGQKN